MSRSGWPVARLRLVLAGGAAAVLALMAGCGQPPRSYATWQSLGTPVPQSRAASPEAELPSGAWPWGGVVSHHLLAAAEIDDWFAGLARRRSVETFYILSPSHAGLSTQSFSLTDGEWLCGDALVRSDRTAAAALAERLGVRPEPAVFDREHGVSTLMPFIARHFPRARVVAVALRGEAPVNQPLADRLVRALAPSFDERGKQRDFLLVSSDFAHHGNLAGTEAKDARTRRFFDAPSVSNWIYAGCDNRPGLYSLARLMGEGDRCAVRFHTNSWRLSGEAPDDITSYFFVYFFSPAG